MKNNEYKVLIVDDEPDIVEFLSYNLKKEEFKVLTACNGKEALKIAEQEIPHLIILDVMMPEIDGIETCEELRQVPELKNTLIIFLTARSEDYSEIAGFKAGADDYISKPVRPKVLISRIQALLKRIDNKNESAGNTIEIGDLLIDKERHLVIFRENELTLPNKEFKLLSLLASKPDRVYTRDEIYNTVWGNDVIVGDRTIDVHIRKLREKLNEEFIKTIKGIGYKFYKE